MRIFERGFCALLLCLAALPVRAEITRLHHDLTVRLDPETRELAADDTLTFTGNGEIALALGAAFSIEAATLDNQALPLQPGGTGRTDGLPYWAIKLGDEPAAHTLTLRYRGKLAPLESAMDHRDVLGPLPAMAGAAASYLPPSSGWYPLVEADTFTYRLRLDLPGDQRGLAPGRLIQEKQSPQGYHAEFEFTHPAEGIHLLAGPYQIKERMLNKTVRLRTYFHPDITSLADGYLDSIDGYMKLYNNWIGAYPFSEFSVVSSPLPTGFGIPTLTYLGIDVLRLPFIRFGSLGHEVLHNWWGNGVYVDWAHGNWSEGLTTFMADYTYKEQESPDAARAMRLGWLRDFAAIPIGQDEPVLRFTSRRHSASQTVGYHKVAFIFLMLRDTLGEEKFNAGLREFWRTQQFRTAGWTDLQRAFEHSARQDLRHFFEQWLTRNGAPRVTLNRVTVAATQKKYRINLTLTQSAPAYTLRVPVVVTTERGKEEHVVELSKQRAHYTVESVARPVSLALDPDLRLFRLLDPDEIPPILRQAINDPATRTAIPSTDADTLQSARQLAAKLLDHAPHFLDQDADLTNANAPLLIIGLHKDVGAFLNRNKLPSKPDSLTDKGTAQVWTARQPNGKVVVVVTAADNTALQALLRPLPHYGQQSFLVFEKNKVIEKGVWPTRGGEWKLAVETETSVPAAP